MNVLNLGDSQSSNDQFSAQASNYFSSYSQTPQLSNNINNNNGYSTITTIQQPQNNYGQAVSAAVQTKRTYEVKPYVMNSDPAIPSIVDVQPSEQPVQVIFRSQSSPVMVQQIHTPSLAPIVEKTNSEDEPHRVEHEVVRPVIQQIREIIQPFRYVSQQIRPVLEEVHTVVAKGQKKAAPLNPYEGQYMNNDKFTPVVMGLNDQSNIYQPPEYGQMALANDIFGQAVLPTNNPIDSNVQSNNNKSNFKTNQLWELYLNANERPLVAKTINFKIPKTKRRIKARMSKKSSI